MKTLAIELAAHLEIKKLTQAELGRRAKVDKAVVWKLFAARAVPKGETFRLLLTKGFGYPEGSKTYNELFALWTQEKAGGKSGKHLIATVLPDKDTNSAALRSAFAAIPAHELPAVMSAVADPEIRAVLPMLLKLRESAG